MRQAPIGHWMRTEWYGDGQHAGISAAVHRTILDQGVLIPEFSGERLWMVHH